MMYSLMSFAAAGISGHSFLLCLEILYRSSRIDLFVQPGPGTSTGTWDPRNGKSALRDILNLDFAVLLRCLQHCPIAPQTVIPSRNTHRDKWEPRR